MILMQPTFFSFTDSNERKFSQYPAKAPEESPTKPTRGSPRDDLHFHQIFLDATELSSFTGPEREEVFPISLGEF
jgi:hypothetical protein